MTQERNERKVYTGRVVSDKMDKTIVVVVETKKTHKIYGKRVKYSKNITHMMKTTLQKWETSLKLWKLVHCLRRNASV